MKANIVHQRLRPSAVQDIGDRNSHKNDKQQRHYEGHYQMPFGGVLRYMVQIARRSFAFTFPYEFERRAAYGGDNARKTVRHSHHTMPATLTNRINIAPNEMAYSMA